MEFTTQGLIFLLQHPERMTKALAGMSKAEIEAHMNQAQDENVAMRVEINQATDAYLEKGIGCAPGWKERLDMAIENRRLLICRLSRELKERQSKAIRYRLQQDRVREA